MTHRLPLAVSMGDPAGIGPEIIAKAWAAREEQELAPFFAVGDRRAIEHVFSGPVAAIETPQEALRLFDHALPVLSVPSAGAILPGRPDADGARCALQALERATSLVQSEAAAALVTAPISKAQLYQIGFNHPGHTEFIAERCNVAEDEVVMMLAGPSLRVVPMTVHVPLAAAPGLLSIERVLSQARTTAQGLYHSFGIDQPRLAFAGINPHAGESGALGREEIDLLVPAIAQLRAEGIDAAGPFPADALFHTRARTGYDAAMCCYHDQALIPIKALHFDEAVNITLGLPIVRTSPDHGTAFAIAGQDVAHPGAMIAALRMATTAVARRAERNRAGKM